MKLHKRIAPDPVAPVELHGLIIHAPHFGYEIGVSQNGGYIEARDALSGEVLWHLMIYETKYIQGKERDVQDVFIVALGVRDGFLRVKEEYGRIYQVDVCNKTIELVYSPIPNEKRLLKKQREAAQAP